MSTENQSPSTFTETVQKAPEVFRKRIVLSSSLFGAVSKSKQRHRITHEALMAANPTKTFSCFLGDSSPLRWGALFAFSSVRHAHTHTQTDLLLLLFFRTRPEKRRLDEHFFLFLLHTSVVSRLLRPQRNFSLTQFESELSSNKKKRKLNQSPSKSEKATKAKLHQPDCTLSGFLPVGGPFH